MATTVRKSLFAVMAAVFFGLSACGGGESSTTVQQVLPFTGTATSSTLLLGELSSKKKALSSSAPAAQAAENFSVVLTVTPTTAAGSGSGASGLAAMAVADTELSSITDDDLFDWAEKKYPQYFPTNEQSISGLADGNTYAYRPYAITGNYVGRRVGGTDDGGIYGIGPYTGGLLERFGHRDDFIREFKCEIKPEVCRPQVVAAGVSPANGSVNIPVKGTKIMFPFDRPLVCPQAPITGNFGAISGTLTCVNTATAAVVTIEAAELPGSAIITATLSGFVSAEGGVPMQAFTLSFTTEVVIKPPPVVKIITVNQNGYLLKTGEVSIVDPTTRLVSQVTLPPVPGYILSSYIDVDSARGVAYSGALGTFVLHRTDVVKGVALPSFVIDPNNIDNNHGHGIHGIAHDDKGTVCIATGTWGNNNTYYARNRLICFDPSGRKVFESPTDWLGDGQMTPTQVLYSATRQKYYVLLAVEQGLFLEWFQGGKGRDGYRPGTRGTVTEIDALTYNKERVWTVGSMPLDGKIEGNTLRIVNAGDKSLSKIDLAATSTVITIDWKTTFTGLTNPTGIEIDLELGVYYVPDWVDSVRVMSLATDQQVGRIVTGDVPWGMGIANGSLFVTAPKKAVFDPTGDSVFEIDRTTRTIKNTITGVGAMPYGLAIYTSP